MAGAPTTDALRHLVATTSERLRSDPSAAVEAWRAAASELDRLADAGAMSTGMVTDAIAWLRGRPPLQTDSNVVTGIVLGAARRLGDRVISHEAARVHADRARWLAGTGAQLSSVLLLLDDALNVAEEFDLSADDPVLVARLHFERGQRLVADPATWPAGLEAMGRAHELLGGNDVDAAQQLGATLRCNASEAVAWAQRHADSPDGGPMSALIFEAAAITFDRIGATTEAGEARAALLRLLLQDHALDSAADHVKTLGDPLTLPTPDRARVADLEAQQGRPERALELLDGLAIEPASDPETFRYVQTIRANAHRVLGHLDEAMAIIDSLVDWLAAVAATAPADIPLAQQLAHGQLTRAQVLAAADDLDGADAAFGAILDRLDELQATDDMRLQLPVIAAQSLWNDGATDHAAPWLDLSMAANRRAAEAHSDPVARVAHLARYAELGVRATRLAGHTGRHRDAVLLGEGSKAAVLTSVTQLALAEPVPIEPHTRRNLMAAVIAAAGDAAAAGSEMEEFGPGDPARGAASERAVAAQNRHRQLTEQLERRLLARIEGPRIEQRALGEHLAQIVDADAAVISFTIGVDGIGAASVGPAGEASVWRSSPTLAELDERIVAPLAQARYALSARGASDRWESTLSSALTDLHAVLGADVRELATKVGGAQVVLIPHRTLHGLPLSAAAGADGRTLADDLGPVSILPALTLLRSPGWRHAPAALTIGRPDDRAALMGLEAAMVAAHPAVAPAAALLGAAATPSAVAHAAKDARLLHFAVHGTYRPGSASASGLLLAPPRDGLEVFGTGSGLLNPSALLGMFSFRSTRLAVLSACESALADPSGTDDRTGLPGLLLAMGVDWVVASNWAVNDVATVLLMCRFYDALGSGISPPGALHEAVQQFRTTPRNELAVELGALREYAGDERTVQALEDGHQSLRSEVEPFGPDAWAAFSAFGAPYREEEPWSHGE